MNERYTLDLYGVNLHYPISWLHNTTIWLHLNCYMRFDVVIEYGCIQAAVTFTPYHHRPIQPVGNNCMIITYYSSVQTVNLYK